MKKSFSSTEAIQFLRYKRRLPSKQVVRDLKQFAENHRTAPGAAAVHYSLARAFLMEAKDVANGHYTRKCRKAGLFHLQKAANYRMLGGHRRRMVEEILDS
jgi:hypothetical protein